MQPVVRGDNALMKSWVTDLGMWEIISSWMDTNVPIMSVLRCGIEPGFKWVRKFGYFWTRRLVRQKASLGECLWNSPHLWSRRYLNQRDFVEAMRWSLEIVGRTVSANSERPWRCHNFLWPEDQPHSILWEIQERGYWRVQQPPQFLPILCQFFHLCMEPFGNGYSWKGYRNQNFRVFQFREFTLQCSAERARDLNWVPLVKISSSKVIQFTWRKLESRIYYRFYCIR